MHFIIETETQLKKLQEYKGICFINLISNNDNYHSKLATPTVLYLRLLDPYNKGFMLMIDHSEGLSLGLDKIIEVLSGYERIYCLNSKYHSYFIDLPLTDINYLLLEQGEKPMENRGDSLLINQFYQRLPSYTDVNKVIPVSKLYEYWEDIFLKIKDYLTAPIFNEKFYSQFDSLYKRVEEKGIKINTQCFSDHFAPRNISNSYKDNIIYTQYNLYNTTCRPSNAFNGINFLAINKEDKSRKCLIPKNDCFVEMDFDGYHIRLIANLIGYTLPTVDSIHTYFGQLYFNKEILTEEEYQESKRITFQNIYGGIKDEYRHIKFFKLLATWLDKLEKSVYEVILPTGKRLEGKEGDNIQKTFNYIIQNMETKMNVNLLSEVMKMMKGKSFINLIVYDSFLIDFSFKDGKDLLINIAAFLKENGFNIKAKYGKNYHDLRKLTYL